MTAIGIVGLGAVGARIARQLVTSGHEVVITDARPALAAAIAADLSVAAVGFDEMKRRSTVIVLATPAPHVDLARDLIHRGCCVISTSDDVTDTEDLLGSASVAATNDVSLVIGAAMSPGLSGLLARTLGDRLDVVDEVHVAAHGTGGPSCAHQHHTALAGTATGWHDGEWIQRPAGSGRELCWFPEPIGARDCYRAELSDPILLHRAFPDAGRVSARLSATRRDRLTARLPMLSPPHREGGLGALRVEVRGSRSGARVTEVAGVAQRSAVVTGALVAAVAACAVDGHLPTGAVILGSHDLPTDRLLDAVTARGISLQEYVGSDA